MHKFFKFCANLTNYRNVIKFNSPKPLAHLSARCCSSVPPNPKGKTASSLRILLTNLNSSSVCTSDNLKTVTNFDDVITNRRLQASQSILVQVNSEKSFGELHTYCSQFGEIVGAHHYTQDDMHYILLEYSSNEAADDAIRSSTFNEATSGIVVHSPFLWFRAGPRPPKTGVVVENPNTTSTLKVVDGNRASDDIEVSDWLQAAESVSDQMQILHRATCLNDIGTRLRFLAARQVEQSLRGMFPNAQACPFGSSVNGFGRLGCDLDLILRLTPFEEKVHVNCDGPWH